MVELASQMRAVFDEVAPPEGRLGTSLGDEICALRLLMDRVEGVYLERLAAFDVSGAAAANGSASTSAWLSRATRISARKAKADLTVARRLYTDRVRPLPGVAHALASGELTVEHVRAIVTGTAHIPVDRIVEAEKALVQVARDLNAGLTGRAAARIHQLLTPEDALERREWARSQRNLDLVQTFEGMWWIQGLLSPEHGVALAAVLDPIARPLRTDGLLDDRSATQRRADALGQLATWAACSGAPPIQGGLRPHLSVRVDLEDLTEGRLGPALVGRSLSEGRGGPLSMWAARMIACDPSVSLIVGDTKHRTPDDPAHDDPAPTSDVHGLVRELLREFAPALGGIPWEVLAVGRSTRLVTPAQRAALNARDRGCVYPGCDRPPEWCDAHHLTHWADGGRTDLNNLALICQRHHTVVHEQDLTLHRDHDGRFTVRARAPALGDTG